jgi:hypothetical protein
MALMNEEKNFEILSIICIKIYKIQQKRNKNVRKGRTYSGSIFPGVPVIQTAVSFTWVNFQPSGVRI